MTRFILTAALALGIGLGVANTADAQYAYRYSTVTPYGGVVTNSGISNGYSLQQYHSYASPYGAVNQRYYYGDAFGNSYGRAAGYNTWTGSGYNRGFYQPSPFVAPYGGGYNYGYYGRRW